MTDVELGKRNMDKIRQEGGDVQPGDEWRSLDIETLQLETAVRLGHAMTIELDKRARCRRYTLESFPLEDALFEAKERARGHKSIVFGETLPRDKNLAVRVQRSEAAFALVAGVRNDYEDNPDLEGGRVLQLGFIAVITSVNL